MIKVNVCKLLGTERVGFGRRRATRGFDLLFLFQIFLHLLPLFESLYEIHYFCHFLYFSRMHHNFVRLSTVTNPFIISLFSWTIKLEPCELHNR